MSVGEEHNTRTVRAHYAALAATYDQKANKACTRAYKALIRQSLGGSKAVLELGAGSSPLAGLLDAPLAMACDLSWPMLAARNAFPALPRIVADGQTLPLADKALDGAFSMNVLEHVPDPARFIAEAARVLAPGGRLLIVTPNGDVAWLLDLLERLRLKLPEGPHAFLGTEALNALAGRDFNVLDHQTFLRFPAGPAGLVQAIDRAGGALGVPGLFQYALWCRV